MSKIQEKAKKAEITDYPANIWIEVECPHCSAIQEVEVPVDDETVRQCQDDNCQEKFLVDIGDL